MSAASISSWTPAVGAMVLDGSVLWAAGSRRRVPIALEQQVRKWLELVDDPVLERLWVKVTGIVSDRATTRLTGACEA